MTTILKTLLTGGLLTLATQTAFAHEFKVGDLEVGHPYSFATPPSAPAAAGYMTIRNDGETADRLIAVRTDFARTMLHETKNDAGTMTMIPQTGGVEIPAGSTVSFEPGGLHVMFMGLSDAFREGEKRPATLVFENAGEITVEFSVDERKKDTVDHSQHGNHGKTN